jgi:hypothetical protein
VPGEDVRLARRPRRTLLVIPKAGPVIPWRRVARMKTSRFLLAGLAAASFGAGGAGASPITYQFNATVTSITDTSPGQTFVPASIKPNISTISGTFTYDTAAPGSPFVRGTALQLGATATVDSTYTYTLTTPTTLDEIDLDTQGLSAGVFKRGPANTTAFGVPISQLEFYGLRSTTNDLGTALLTTGILTPSIGIADAFSPGQPYYFIGGTITSLQPLQQGSQTGTGAPEPGTLALLSLSLGLLGSYGAWRRRRAARPAEMYRLAGAEDRFERK